jgi:CheY-like chemotaxis protein
MAQTREKILCIEDDRETAALIAEEFIDRGFDVITTYSGQEGLLAIMKATPDLVLCEISMPTMGGFEVLGRLNELAPRLGRIPFVFLTALADRESELKGRRLGADDYVTKPIDLVIAGHHSDSPKFQSLRQVHRADGDVAAGRLHVLIEDLEWYSGLLCRSLRAIQLIYGSNE